MTFHQLLTNPLAAAVGFLLGVLVTLVLCFFLAEHIAAMKAVIGRRRVPYDVSDGLLDMIAILRSATRRLAAGQYREAEILVAMVIHDLGRINRRDYDAEQPSRAAQVGREAEVEVKP
jgi:ABC-type phosphate/phosphonate transport system permease subunit